MSYPRCIDLAIIHVWYRIGRASISHDQILMRTLARWPPDRCNELLPLLRRRRPTEGDWHCTPAAAWFTLNGLGNRRSLHYASISYACRPADLSGWTGALRDFWLVDNKRNHRRNVSGDGIVGRDLVLSDFQGRPACPGWTRFVTTADVSFPGWGSNGSRTCFAILQCPAVATNRPSHEKGRNEEVQ